MFVFLTSIRNPKNANNYAQVLKMLERTIESICNQQTRFEYKFLIVCNEIPAIKVDSSKVEFLQVDFLPPGDGVGSRLKLEDVLKDKGTKLAAGLIWMQHWQPSKVFIVDADDWININLVEYVQSNPDTDFWHVNRGYLVNLADKKTTRKFGLCRYCGTAYIYDYQRLLSILEYCGTYNIAQPQSYIIDHVNEFSLYWLLGDHRHLLGHFHKNNLEIKPLPLNAICWILDTGENHSGKTGGSSGVPISTKITRLFGVNTFDVPKRNTSLLERFTEIKAMLSSYIGWALTDKTAKKV